MGDPAAKVLVVSGSAPRRLARARAWLEGRGAAEEIAIVAASASAANDLARVASVHRGGSFGWHRASLVGLAATLAAPRLAARGLVAASGVALEALCARVVHRAHARGELGRLAPIGDRPGLPRALARTIGELRMASIGAGAALDPDLARLLASYEAELAAAKLADRATVLAEATEAVRHGEPPFAPRPILFLDVAVSTAAERDLVGSLVARSSDVLATTPLGDARSLAGLRDLLGDAISLDAEGDDAVARVQRHLFSDRSPAFAPLDASVRILSAPGESRECVEIARRIHREAAAGVPFDRIAILVRSPTQYRAHLEEALRRAGIPAHFARGTTKPDPSGRAFLSLLACAAEDLSARRFAEYLSLGELPEPDEAGAPPGADVDAHWVAPDEDTLPRALARGADEPGEVRDEDGGGATLRTPRRWERLLVDAAVIGGRDRWEKRLAGRKKELGVELAALEVDEPSVDRIRRDVAAIDSLWTFAAPLLDALVALPRAASWGEWLDALSALATRALRRPDRVLATLGELAPMAAIGPVGLREVRLALGRRLSELVAPPAERRYGRVFVGTALEARGVAFDVVFVPGLAEKLFPQKVAEDPILRDADRRALARELATNAERAQDERLALRLAVGAAEKRLVVSYPRVDVDQARPRTPSFYALEVLRAAEGRLPGFEELAKRAEEEGTTRLGWPAPASPADAIDEAEHDLALLARVFALPTERTTGTARYLLSANVHLARALRARGRKWRKGWFSVDGLVDPIPEAKEELAHHQLAARSFSPTALQSYASCPYRFFLYSVHRLAPREVPVRIEQMDALQKGSLVHEVQFELHVELRDAKLLPITPANLETVRARLDAVLARVAAKYHDDLAPAIERVWDDGIESIKMDLREWLRRAARETEWVPTHFELAFGPLPNREGRDAASTPNPVPLDCGINLRGSIDVVEQNARGEARASDYKTGKARAKSDAVIGGGEVLQPVFYALVLEKLLAGKKAVAGRLYYCTSVGEFKSVEIPLDQYARDEAKRVAEAVDEALTTPFLPAYPSEGACEWCDYLPVCGPHEESRSRRKSRDKRLEKLIELRKRP